MNVCNDGCYGYIAIKIADGEILASSFVVNHNSVLTKDAKSQVCAKPGIAGCFLNHIVSRLEIDTGRGMWIQEDSRNQIITAIDLVEIRDYRIAVIEGDYTVCIVSTIRLIEDTSAGKRLSACLGSVGSVTVVCDCSKSIVCTLHRAGSEECICDFVLALQNPFLGILEAAECSKCVTGFFQIASSVEVSSNSVVAPIDPLRNIGDVSKLMN